MAGADRLAQLRASVLERVRPALGIVGQEPVLIGLSGGADSAVCAWAIVELRGTRNLSTCYVDHGWVASQALGDAAAKIATQLGVQHGSVSITVPEGPSPETAARKARYEALSASADAWLVTGHTRDDQAETLLLHLMRGTGLDGMAAMRPVRGIVVRPLLAVGRSETRELADLLELEYFDDPSNENVAWERNRVRSLLRDLDEGDIVVKSLARSADIVRDDVEVLGELADQISVVERGGRIGVPAPALTSVPPAVGRRVIRRALRRVRGPYAGTSAEVERVLSCLAGETGAQELAGDVTVERTGPWLWFSQGGHHEPPVITVEMIDLADPPLFYPSGHWHAVFDGVATIGAIIRPCRSEDVVELAGGGHKPVYEVLAEAGITARDRSSWPVVVVGDRVAWVVGCRTAAWSWVTATSTSYRYASAQVQE